MKKSILIFVTVFAASISVATAQFNKGQKIISGGLSFNTTSYNYTNSPSDKMLSTGINFSYGKFISPLHAIGGGAFYNYAHISSGFKSDTHNFGVNFFSDYYKPLFKNFYVLLNWGSYMSLNLSRTTQNNLTSNGTGFTIGTGLNPGFAYKLNDRFLFNATLNNLITLAFTNTNYTNSTQKSSNNFSLSSSLSAGSLQNVSLGFTYLLK